MSFIDVHDKIRFDTTLTASLAHFHTLFYKPIRKKKKNSFDTNWFHLPYLLHQARRFDKTATKSEILVFAAKFTR